MRVTFFKTYYQGRSSIAFSNGTLSLICPLSCGPRILSFGFTGEENIFAHSKRSRRTPWGTWRLYGGHRLWIAPEDFPRTYLPDNDPVEYSTRGETLLLTAQKNRLGIQKEISLLFTAADRVRVTHRVRFSGGKPVSLSLWPITALKPGGIVYIPRNTKKEDPYGQRPIGTVVLWNYSEFDPTFVSTSNACWKVRRGRHRFSKIGFRVVQGWAAYHRNALLFTKRFHYVQNGTYPDLSANVEIFLCREFTELETISPQETRAPGTAIAYTEEWHLTRTTHSP